MPSCRDGKRKAPGMESHLAWLPAMQKQAEGNFEGALDGYRSVLEGVEDGGSAPDEVLAFVVAQASSAYASIADWAGLEAFFEYLEACRPFPSGRQFPNSLKLTRHKKFTLENEKHSMKAIHAVKLLSFTCHQHKLMARLMAAAEIGRHARLLFLMPPYGNQFFGRQASGRAILTTESLLSWASNGLHIGAKNCKARCQPDMHRNELISDL